MRQVNENIIPSQAAATITTAAIPAMNLFMVSAQLVAVGASSAGVLKLQASNDEPVTGTPANWSDISGATVTVGAAGVFLIPKTELCYQWIRFVYTNSGTGTISLVFKALGA